MSCEVASLQRMILEGARLRRDYDMISSGNRGPIFDVAVVGGGPAGTCAAIALARSGSRTMLIAPEPPPPGTGTQARTAALFEPALKLLERCGAWPACRNASAALRGIRLIDQTTSPFGLKAPEVLFEAHEIGLDAFGYNIPNAALMSALRDTLPDVAGLTVLAGRSVERVEVADGHVGLWMDDGTAVGARLIAAADGRHSICRASAGIDTSVKDTDQVALTGIVSHSRPHYGISTEIHSAAGPCTVVPMPPPAAGAHASSLVWIERSAVARRLQELDDGEFLAALGARLTGLLGELSAITGRGRFDLAFVRAANLGRRRTILLAEAAHAMPPIGAQGLNLSLRDISSAVEFIGRAVASGADPGSDDVLQKYEKSRRADIAARMGAVEALNGSLLMNFGPLNLMRGAGLHAVRALPPLRRQLMRLGLG